MQANTIFLLLPWNTGEIGNSLKELHLLDQNSALKMPSLSYKCVSHFSEKLITDLSNSENLQS